MEILTLDQIIKFWSKVNKTDTCWLWQAGLDSDGYGGVSINTKSYKAHRISWFLEYGIMPVLDVLHHCVNPDHLFLGTCQDNVNDALSKGRRAFGQAHCFSKVTDLQVQEIKFKVALGLSCAYVGKLYGLGASQVHRICTNKSRKQS